MAGSIQALFRADFTSQSVINVVHSLGRLQVAVIVRIGATARNDLIESVVPTIGNERNAVTVTLTSAQTGSVLVVDTDYVFASIPKPETTAALGEGSAITAAAVDLRGDLLAGTADDTIARLPVGTDGHVLTADSAEATGLKWAAGGGGSVYGSEYQSAVDRTFRSSTGQTWFEVHKLTTTSLPAGTFRVEWNYVWSADSIQNDFLCQVTVDDTTQLYEQASGGSTAFDSHRQEPKDSSGTGDGGTDQRHVTSFWADVTLSAGVHEIDIDIANTNNGVISSVHLSTIAIYRLS